MSFDNHVNPYVSPEIVGGTAAETAGSYRDRSVGLALFGVLQLLIACFWALMIPFVAFTVTMAEPAAVGVEVGPLVPILLSYAAVAAVFGTLGVGSLLARRWARALTLVLAWPWLAMGLAGTIGILFFIGSLFPLPDQQGLPPQALFMMYFAMTGTIGCVYLMLPGAFVLFYRSPHVKATCEHRNPMECWTDRCPLPVLGMSVIVGMSGLAASSRK